MSPLPPSSHAQSCPETPSPPRPDNRFDRFENGSSFSVQSTMVTTTSQPPSPEYRSTPPAALTGDRHPAMTASATTALYHQQSRCPPTRQTGQGGYTSLVGHGGMMRQQMPSHHLAHSQSHHHQELHQRDHPALPQPHGPPFSSIHQGSQEPRLGRHPQSPYRHPEEHHNGTTRYPVPPHGGVVYAPRAPGLHQVDPRQAMPPPHMGFRRQIHADHHLAMAPGDPRFHADYHRHHRNQHADAQHQPTFPTGRPMHVAGEPCHSVQPPQYMRHPAMHPEEIRYQGQAPSAHHHHHHHHPAPPPHAQLGMRGPPSVQMLEPHFHHLQQPQGFFHRIPTRPVGSRSPSPPSTTHSSPSSLRQVVRAEDVPKSPYSTPPSSKRVSETIETPKPLKRQKSDEKRSPPASRDEAEESDSEVSTRKGLSPNSSVDLTVDAASILLGLRSTIQRNENAAKSPSRAIVASSSMDTDVSSLPHGSSSESSQDSSTEKECSTPQKFDYPTRLALPNDETKLNSLHCFLRSELLEVFVVEKSESKLPIHAPGSCIGRVGLRCVHCALVRKERDEAPMAVFYPRSISEIYRLVTSWQRCHLRKCRHLPPAVRARWTTLRENDKSRGKTHYWITSAKEIGLVDSQSRAGGIHFENIPIIEPSSPPNTPSNSKISAKVPARIEEDDTTHRVITKTASSDSSIGGTVVSLSAAS